MPRKRRNKRQRKKGFEENLKIDCVRSCEQFDSLEHKNINSSTNINLNNIITPLLATPSPKIDNNSAAKHRNQKRTPILDLKTESTPVNLTKSFKRNRISYYDSPNVTNISFLFNLENSGKQSNSDVNLSVPEKTRRPVRSCSSIAKLHSPGLEKVPITVDVSTQTVCFKNKFARDVEKCDISVQIDNVCSTNDLIVDTPKISQADLLDEAELTPKNIYEVSEKPKPIFIDNYGSVNLNKVGTLRNFNETESYAKNLNVDYYKTRVFVEANLLQKNPYFRLKNKSAGEMSFFNSHLYDLKSASTPIEKLEQERQNVALPAKLNNASFACPSSTPRPKSLARSFNNEICKRPSYRNYKSLNVPFSKVKVNNYNRNRNLSMPSYGVPIRSCSCNLSYRRFSFDGDVSFGGGSNLGARLFMKIKRYGRASAKWSMKLVELCSWLGITIKKGLTSLYKYYTGERSIFQSGLKSITSSNCKCEQYQSEITTLTVKIDGLDAEIKHVKARLEDSVRDEEKIEQLNRELSEVKAKLSSMEEFRKEIDEIRKQVNNRGDACVARPPPPPPLPPPLPILAPMVSRLPVSKKSEKKRNENSRPIISLDDILKVKLKKTSRERCSPLRRSSQPEMLKQIKLRPASRPHTPLSLQETSSNCSSVSTSPHSSLTRILSSVDTNVCRLKRLKRTANSFDDDSRRSRYARLERDRVAA